MNVGDVVVHKSLGNQPLVVVDTINCEEHPEEGVIGVVVSYGTQGSEGIVFREETFSPEELETPIESMSREAEIFKSLNAKKDEINASISKPAGISHLN